MIKIGNIYKVKEDRKEKCDNIMTIHSNGEVRVLEIDGDYIRYEVIDTDENVFDTCDCLSLSDLIDPEVKEEKAKPYTHLVTWEIRGCGDPTEFFNTLANARKKANELANDRNVEVKSIRIVEIKNMWLVNPSINLAKTTN